MGIDHGFLLVRAPVTRSLPRHFAPALEHWGSVRSVLPGPVFGLGRPFAFVVEPAGEMSFTVLVEALAG